MKVMIIGHGYVGSAVASIFTDEEKIIIDPKLSDDIISNHSGEKFDAVFVCVDTPKENNHGLLDIILNQVDQYIGEKTPVCCKSTANPNYYFESQQRYKNIHVLHSPEYLDSRHNIEKFRNQNFCVIGGDENSCMKIVNIFVDRLPNLTLDRVKITDIKTASLVKYAENFFLSAKVTIFNELYKIHKNIECNSSFDEFRELVGMDERIGISHTQVPGWDGEYGWGGHCFMKDNYELEKFSKSPIVKYIRDLNQIHREIK